MLKQRGSAAVVILIIVVLVAGIAGGSLYISQHKSLNSQPVMTPTPAPTATPFVTATPSPSPSASPETPSSGSSVNLDNTNNHQTVHVKVGETITITLKAADGMTDYTLTEPFSPVLTPIPSGIIPARGVMIRSFKVSGQGTVHLTASSSAFQEVTPGNGAQTNSPSESTWEVTLIAD